MSRSYKKPFHLTACCKKETVRFFKKHERRKERRYLNGDLENSSLQVSKKKFQDPWTMPGDGKTYNPDWKKAWRK